MSKASRTKEAKKKINGIFYSEEYINSTSSNIKNNRNTQIRTGDRVHLLSNKVSEELNTYLHFGVFPTFSDTYNDNVIEKKTKIINKKNNKEEEKTDYNYDKSDAGTPGVRSLFNRAGAIILGSKSGCYNIDPRNPYQVHPFRISNNVPLMDSPGTRRSMKMANRCSIKDLVTLSERGLMGQETYAYSDFMYCKHLGRVSNNYMITLRRFPAPVNDFISTTDHTGYNDTFGEKGNVIKTKDSACIGCMVTWLGVSGNELNNILKYSFKMPFKEQQSELQDSKTDADSNKTIMAGMFSAFDKSYRKQYADGRGGEAFNSAMSHFGITLGDPPYTDHRGFKDRNKVYGPVDAIKSTYIRSDEGLIFKQNMTLTFEYELRSYNGINTRQAMLDLISNILNVTYTTGSFWGGGIKSYGAAESNIFTNLNIFKTNGTFTDFADAFAKDLTTIGNKVTNIFGDNGEFTLASAWKTLKGALNTLGGMLIGGMLNKLGRPQKAMYNSLLSPAPIGFWHVTIGNPRAPIMSIGNMVITNVTIEHNGPLGLDDFPTDLKVTVELDRGKPRDLRDIEKIYMHGNDRIYSPMSDKVFNMYYNSVQYKNAINKNETYDPRLKKKDANGKDTKEDLVVYGKKGTKSNDDSNKPTQLQGKNRDGKIVNSVNISSSQDKMDQVISNDDTRLEIMLNTMQKYFGSNDIFSLYFASAEQEYGASAKEKITTTEQYKNSNGEWVNRTDVESTDLSVGV